MVEILIAIGVMTIGITASISILTVVESGVSQTSREMEAVFFAEEGIQASISISDRSWTALAVGTHGLGTQASPLMWIFSGTSDTLNGMTRVVTVSTVDADTKKIDVTVSWNPAPNRTATVNEQLLITDWPFI